MATQSGPRSSFYRRLTGRAQFWGADQVVETHPAEFLDQASECQRVSLAVAEKYELDIVVGWAAIESGEMPWHCWNLDHASGQVVDAAGLRRCGVGYVGKVLLPIEQAMLARSAAVPTGREVASNLAETAGAVGAGLSRIFGG